MECITRGATRTVFLIGGYAFKFPSCRSWRFFLQGLLANIQEREFSKTKWPELCPVVFAIPGGFLTVMQEAEPMPDEIWNDLNVETWANREGYTIPVEAKQSSFGILNGKIVVVDYGN